MISLPRPDLPVIINARRGIIHWSYIQDTTRTYQVRNRCYPESISLENGSRIIMRGVQGKELLRLNDRILYIIFDDNI